MVNKGQRITDRGTRQGTWVFAAGGALLGRVNTSGVDQVLEMLQKALDAFEDVPPEGRRLPAKVSLHPEHRWEQSYPEEGLVLDRIARDLTEQGLAADPDPRWNRDWAWFSKAEVSAMVPAEVAVGDEFELPLLARRLTRFHLLDNVRGQTLPFADEEIKQAHITAQVTARVGEQFVMALAGKMTAVAEGPWLLGENLWKPELELPHQIDGQLLGKAVFDAASGSFTAFELVAIARWKGRTQLNGRPRDAEQGLIGFHLQKAAPTPRIAPTFVAIYDAEWIARPEVGTWLRTPKECGLEEE